MAFIPLRTEKSITEIADKVFGNLSETNRTQAEAALIKENPALKNFSDLKPGTLIRIPKVPDLKQRNTRSISDPEGDLVKEYMDQLKSFSDSLQNNNEKLQKQQREAIALLKKEEISALINKNPQASKLSEQLQQHIDEDTKNRKQLISDHEVAIKALKADLEKLLK